MFWLHWDYCDELKVKSLFYLIIWIISTCYMASDILPFCFFPVWSETTLQVSRADGVCWLRACCLWAEKVSGWVWVDFTPLTIPWGFSHHHHQQRQAQFSSSTCMEIAKADQNARRKLPVKCGRKFFSKTCSYCVGWYMPKFIELLKCFFVVVFS